MTKDKFTVVGSQPDQKRYQTCRRMLVGPWCKQPNEYQGYNGFVGWAGVAILKSGRWVLAFNSGYWHASYPWTPEIHESIQRNAKFYEMFQSWRKLGMPDIYAPRGGRCHLMHSDDGGVTWSDPRLLVDTEWTDVHPTIVQLDDGAVLCTFCSDSLPLQIACRYMRSDDGGVTWSEAKTLDDVHGGFGNGSTIKLADGTILWAIEDRVEDYDEFFGRSPAIAIYRSPDHGRSFHRHATVNFGHDVYEPSIVELPDHRLALIARREGEIFFSDDGGKTWPESVSTGVDMFDPHLLMMPNGVLACFHGSYSDKAPGNLRVILSPDLGRTWNGPMDHCGYTIDPSVYGYCHPMVLSDGSVYLAYIHTGGHSAADARTEAIWAIRVKVSDTADGIEILPAPGSPEALGYDCAGLSTLPATAGNPELGNYANRNE